MKPAAAIDTATAPETIAEAAQSWPGGWLCHLSEWARLCEDVFGAEDVSIGVTQPHPPALMAWWPLALRSGKGFRVLESAAFGGYGGPLINPMLDAGQQDAARRLLMERLASALRAHRVDRVRVLPWPGAFQPELPAAWWQAAGFQLHPHEVYVIDLTQPLDRLKQRCAQNVRHAIGQAQRYGVTVRRDDSPEALETFYALFLETYRRTKTRPIAWDYFRRLRDAWGGARGALALFVASRGDQPLAAALVAVWKGWAVYWSSGSSAEGLRLRANNLMQWEIITWLKSQGVPWYELGREEPSERSGKQQRIDFFKTRFGVDRQPAVAWVRDVQPLRCRGYDLIRRVRAGIRL